MLLHGFLKVSTSFTVEGKTWRKKMFLVVLYKNVAVERKGSYIFSHFGGGGERNGMGWASGQLAERLTGTHSI